MEASGPNVWKKAERLYRLKRTRWSQPLRALAVVAACALTLHAPAQMVMSAHTLIEAEQQHGTSGTSIEPASTPVPMLMTQRDAWRLMLHANAFAANTQQQAETPA